MLRSDLCDYSDAYISISLLKTLMMLKKRNKKLILKINASFKSCISNINDTLIDNAEDLYIIMFMYNFLENSHNYSITSGTLWNYYRDDVNNDIKENNNFGNYRINNIKTTSTKSFEYKIILIGSTADDDNTLDEKVAFTLKYLGNFWRFQDLPLTNCEIELALS